MARLYQANLPVPEGFILTAHEAACIATPRLEETDTSHILREMLKEAYHALRERTGSPRVAVRSAGPLEDGNDTSYAGQYETFLNIDNEEALLQAVCSCALSGENSRLHFYQEAMQTGETTSPAVIVQQMIDAEAAGVVFTIHPITGDNRFLLVEATPGLGDTLVSGLETPARLMFSRQGKPHTLIGTERLPNPFRVADFWQPLIALARAVESTLQAPQDIEWAYAEGKFWILQARAITTQKSIDPPPDHTQWTRANVGEVLSGVPTPLTWSTFIHVVREAEDPHQSPRPSEMARRFGGRVYMQRQALWDSYAHIWGLKTEIILGRGIGCDTEGLETLRAAQATPSFSTRLIKNLYVWRELLTRKFVHPKLEKALSALGPQLVFLTEENLRAVILPNLRKHLRASLVVARQTFQAHMQASFFAFCSYAATWQQLATTLGEQDAAQWMATFRIPPKDKALWDTQLTALVSRVHATPSLNHLFRTIHGEELYQALSSNLDGQSLLSEIRRRARIMGDRAAQEFELRAPRWSEDPRMLVSAIQARLLSAGHPTQPIPKNLRDSHIFQPTRHMGLLRRPLFPKVRDSFTTYTRMRERTKGLLMACFSELRRSALAIGQRMYERGYLPQVDDVFFLTLDEMDNLLVGQYPYDLPERLSQRRRELVYQERHIPSIPATHAPHGSLYGTAVSSGRVTGRARVVRSPNETLLKPGDILVTEATDPGWLPAFITAGGIVTEIGGLLSHTATLARELGKPAVFAVPGATQRIRDGQKIMLDGWEGTVTLLDESTE